MNAGIRPASVEDVTTLARLGRETGKAYFSEIWTPAALEAFIERDFSVGVLQSHIEHPDRHCYTLIEFENQPVGFTRINWKRPVPMSDAVGAELQKIYFLPGFTGKGLGTRLLKNAMELARSRHDPLIWLDVLSVNPRARKLYEKHGFAVTGKLPFRTDVVNITRHVMVRRLASEA